MEKKYNLLSIDHYRWLTNICKYYTYEEVHEALKQIRQYNIENKEQKSNWVNKSKLKRQQYWILSSLVDKYNYNDVLNSMSQYYLKK